MGTKIVTVSELKANLAGLIAQLDAESVPIFMTQRGKPKAVLVQYEEYEALLARLDDLEDALAMRETLSSPSKESASLEECYRQRSTQAPGYATATRFQKRADVSGH